MLDLYLHRGSFETVLADEDQEQETDRWCSRTPWGQEAWQIVNQWVWNLRLELGQCLTAAPMRTTEFAPASEPAPAMEYGPPQWARRSFMGGFPGSAFAPQSDGSLLCPATHLLYPQEHRPERDGSYRVLYAARIGDCRTCQLRAQCQESPSSSKPRRVSAVFWPRPSPTLAPPPPVLEQLPSSLPSSRELSPTHPVLMHDWPRCQIRRNWLKVVRSETVIVAMGVSPTPEPLPATREQVTTRAERAHWRLSWRERLARNGRPEAAPPLILTLHGLPARFAHPYGFALLETA